MDQGHFISCSRGAESIEIIFILGYNAIEQREQMFIFFQIWAEQIMLTVLNQPDSLLKGMVLSKPSGLYVKRRDDLMLVLNPRMGLYSIMSEPYISFFRKLTRPISFVDFIANDQGIPPAMYVAFMEETYRNGLLALSGKTIDSPLPGPVKYRRFRTVIAPLTREMDPRWLADQIIKFGKQDCFSNLAINFRGNPSLCVDELKKLTGILREELSSDSDGIAITLAFDVSSSGVSKVLSCLGADLPVTLNYTVFGDENSHDRKFGAGSFNQVLDEACNAIEEGFYSSVTGIFNNPEEVFPAMTAISRRPITNIGLRIDRQVILGDAPVSSQLRLMEAFARNTLDFIDFIIKDPNFLADRVYFNDIQQMAMKLMHNEVFFPCSTRPCGMGSQVLVIQGPDNAYSCLPGGPQSQEALKVSPDDGYITGETWKNRDMLPPRCGRCNWQGFCNSGCPVLRYEKFGTLEKEDPRCRYFQVVFEELLWKIHRHPALVAKIGGLA